MNDIEKARALGRSDSLLMTPSEVAEARKLLLALADRVAIAESDVNQMEAKITRSIEGLSYDGEAERQATDWFERSGQIHHILLQAIHDHDEYKKARKA